MVSGYFDPMLAWHAERLAEIKQNGASLLVLVAESQNAILPTRARAELVAALRVVDFVAAGSPVPAQFRLEAEDADRLAGLIEHVHARQNAAS